VSSKIILFVLIITDWVRGNAIVFFSCVKISKLIHWRVFLGQPRGDCPYRLCLCLWIYKTSGKNRINGRVSLPYSSL